MAHKTKINGTAYSIKGGKTKVNGTAYSIKKGMTKVNGTSRSITFGKAIELRTWAHSDSLLEDYISIIDKSTNTQLAVYDGSSATHINTVMSGSTLELKAYFNGRVSNAWYCNIKINGTTVKEMASTSGWITYEYIVPENINSIFINMITSYDSYAEYGAIELTES